MIKRYKILNKDLKKKQSLFRVQDTFTGKIIARAMSVDAIHSKWHKLEQEHRMKERSKEKTV